VVGLSTGAFATLHFGMTYGYRATSITVAGGGYGSHPSQYREFQSQSKKNAELIKREGIGAFVEAYGRGPQRVQLEIKDPRGFEEYLRQFKEHSGLGAINTLLGVQCRRPSFYDLIAEMGRIDVPALIMSGDEEEPCLEVNLLMKRAIPTAGLAILPRSGHAINLEEPQLFNRLLEDFFHQVEAGRWGARDARSTIPSVYGASGKP
jgi:pimeloyl-ACP methyl ester carboxylesterase